MSRLSKPHVTTLAQQVAEQLLADRVMAAQIKEHIPVPLLLEILDVTPLEIPLEFLLREDPETEVEGSK